MAGSLALTSWEGELTSDYLAQPLPDPAAFGDRLPQPSRRVHGGEFGYAGQPEAFAATLRDVLDDGPTPRG